MTARVTTGGVAWRLSRYRLGLAAATMAFQVVSNGLLVGIGVVLQRIFDALTHAAPAGLGVYELIAVLVAVEVVRIAVGWVSNVVWTACWQQMLGLLRFNVLRAQMQSGGPEAGTPAASAGEAVSRLRHEIVDLGGFVDTFVFVSGRAMFAVGSVVLMIQVSPLITLAVVLPLVAMVIAARLLSGRIRANRRAYQRATAAVSGFVGEMFGAVLAIKAAGAGEAVRRRLATLNDNRERMPDGVATLVGSRGMRLSGGQLQRTATARAIVRHPDLLVLDDVSSALDVHTEHELWDRLLEVDHTERTLLVVSNRPATAARADQVIHLHGGTMV